MVCVGGASVLAQPQITVQLPTFNFTTVQTTVSVPDGGTGLLGGIGRASEGSVTRGVPLLSKIPGANRLFKNRGIGREVEASNMTIIPRIIIQEEEEFLQTGVSSETLSQFSRQSSAGGLASRIAPRAAEDSATSRQADFIAQHVARHDLTQPAPKQESSPPTVDEVKRKNELAKAERRAEADEFFAQAQRAETQGKRSVAKIYLQMAARRAEGELLDQVIAHLATLESAEKSTKLAADR
jgi:hypothetical protein